MLTIADAACNRLKDYLPERDGLDAFANLSPRQCQMAFQNWVAYGRTVSPNGRAREHLTCPLLWCRHNFEDLESCLQHVSSCQWLSNAWYWCPRCQRAELFTPEESNSALPYPYSIRQKDSKMRRAISFFKQIGRRSHSQQRELVAITAPSCNQEKLVPGIDKKSIGPQRQSIDTISDPQPERNPHSFDEDFYSPKDRPKSDLTSQNVSRPSTLYDMEANALSPLRGVYDTDDSQQAAELATSDPLFNSAQLGDNVVAELPGSYQDDRLSQTAAHFHPPSHYGPFSLSLYFRETDGIVFPVSSNFGPQHHNDSHITNMTSPISPLDPPHATSWITNGEDSDGLEFEANDGKVMASKFAAGDLKVKPGSASDLGFEQSYKEVLAPSALCSETPEKTSGCLQAIRSESLVEDLDALVCGLHNHWATSLPERALYSPSSRAHRTPGVLRASTSAVEELRHVSNCNNLCGLSPFEAGLRALQQCFQGSPPVTFEGVFSIVQLAYACAYLLNEAGYSWQELFEDALQWQYLIQSEADRALYITIVNSLWNPLPSERQISPATAISENELLALPQVPNRDLGNMDLDEGRSIAATERPVIQPPISSQVESDLSTPNSTCAITMREGSIIRTCTRYLDGRLSTSVPICVSLAKHYVSQQSSILALVPATRKLLPGKT